MPQDEQIKPAPIATAGAVVDYRDSWKIFSIISEFIEGYQFLADLHKEVTIYGSARLPANTKYYKVATELGHLLGKNGFTTITGGGPGIMEAANKGAYEANGESVGLNIQLPFEQRINPFVKKSIAFRYFFPRKVMLTSPANAGVFFPGGFGTLDEFFEVVDFMELGQIAKTPIVLVGREFWSPLLQFLRNQSCAEVHSVDEKNINEWHVVDDAHEAFEFIKDVPDHPNEVFGPEHNQGLSDSGPDWRVFRIMSELVDGFEFLSKLPDKNVTLLGTGSVHTESPYYDAAYQVGQLLAEHKYVTITGGGPGIMEAANKGAYETGGVSVGINIRLERGERTNAYLNRSIAFSFPFVRKLIITAPSKAFVFFPGGFGTLHQLFELLTLIETKKTAPVPIFLYGKSFWEPLVQFIHSLHNNFKTINELDEQFFQVVDSPSELISLIPHE